MSDERPVLEPEEIPLEARVKAMSYVLGYLFAGLSERDPRFAERLKIACAEARGLTPQDDVATLQCIDEFEASCVPD